MLSLLAVYKQWLVRRPIVTKGITCGVLFTIGDYLAQKCRGLAMFRRRKWREEVGQGKDGKFRGCWDTVLRTHFASLVL